VWEERLGTTSVRNFNTMKIPVFIHFSFFAKSPPANELELAVHVKRSLARLRIAEAGA
jgi:hypothetical protein